MMTENITTFFVRKKNEVKLFKLSANMQNEAY